MQLLKLSPNTSGDVIHDEMKTWEDLGLRIDCKVFIPLIIISNFEVSFATSATEFQQTSEIFNDFSSKFLYVVIKFSTNFIYELFG